VDIQYRVRGRSSSHSARGTPSNNNNNNNTNNNELRTDSALRKPPLDPERELELSRKAVEKQQKLQNWLLEKERRELLKLQQEHEFADEQRRALAERDAKFFKHAQAAKKKLLAAKSSEPETGR
jgi:kinesin family protein 3/17